MAIKFLKDHEVQSVPLEKFTAGQVVEDRDAASELHFVRRGIAAYVDGEGKLFDHEGREVAAAAPTAVTLNVSDNRDGEVGRAGETRLADGAPQRASSGPAEVVTSSAVTAGESARAPAKKASAKDSK